MSWASSKQAGQGREKWSFVHNVQHDYHMDYAFSWSYGEVTFLGGNLVCLALYSNMYRAWGLRGMLEKSTFVLITRGSMQGKREKRCHGKLAACGGGGASSGKV